MENTEEQATKKAKNRSTASSQPQPKQQKQIHTDTTQHGFTPAAKKANPQTRYSPTAERQTPCRKTAALATSWLQST